MPGLPGAKIRKSSCNKIPRSSYGRQAGAAGRYQDLVGRCSASSPADDTSRFGAATSRSLSTTGSAGGRETVEHPFGTLKARIGATHFLMKTLPRVATEMALHVLAYNLTRVMNIMGPGQLIAAMRA